MSLARALSLITLVIALIHAAPASAGPPFLTDDPEPVPLGGWELYAASQWTAGHDAAAATAPHFEVNYGALPGLQLHAIVPAALAWTRGAGTEYGVGDIELGFKLRLLEERPHLPSIGIFPLLTLPTGSETRGLGAGAVQGVIPVWLQKGFGRWLSYGGAGVELDKDQNAVFVGWLVQRQLSPRVALGAEAFVRAPLDGEQADLQLDLGAVVDFSDHSHFLISAGPAFRADHSAQGYLAYLFTL